MKDLISICNFWKKHKVKILTVLVVILLFYAIGIKFNLLKSILNINVNSDLVNIISVTGVLLAVFVAWKQLGSINKHNRHAIFLQLLKELGERDKRKSRRLILELYEETNLKDIKEIIGDSKKHYYRIKNGRTSIDEYRDAIEETISFLDRLSYFLIKGGNEFIKDAPIWIWTITSQMYEKTDWYIDFREKTHPGYVKYFKELNKIAEEELKKQEDNHATG
ncbi:MAG: hypothetical protein PHQ86_00100 [Dehalococcoidales bacterium]|nr:hypothetical protein [Dehalococcoidales bacterium]